MTWRPLSESHPDDLTLVLITDGREVALATRELRKFSRSVERRIWIPQNGEWYLPFEPTHWMPVPTLPEPGRFRERVSKPLRNAFENMIRAGESARPDWSLGVSREEIDRFVSTATPDQLEEAERLCAELGDPKPRKGVVLDFRTNGKRG